MAEKLRVGVIGVGFGARVQLPGFQSHPQTEVVAVCSARPERVQEVAQGFGIPHAFSDYRQLLELRELDAVSIVTPPALHHPMTLEALAAGKHVLCEKPMALNLAQAREMEEAGRRSGRLCMIDHEFRFLPARARMKELIQEGFLGGLHLLHMSAIQGFRADPRRPWNWWSQRSQGGGLLGAFGSHAIDAARHWFGEIEAVLGQVDTVIRERPLPGGGQPQPVDADETFTLLLRFRQGGRAHLVATAVAHAPSGNRFEAYGSQGTLVSDGQERLWGARAGESALQELPIPERLLPSRFGSHLQDSRLGAFLRLVDIFVRGIREGAPVAPSFSDGLKVQEVMDAAHLSHREQRWVELPLI